MPPRRAILSIVPVLGGMAMCHLFAAAWVYAGNRALADMVRRIADQGYQPVPNLLVMDRLYAVSTALYGAILFTLSLGAGLSLAAFGAWWLWKNPLREDKVSAGVFCLAWLALTVWVNTSGFAPWPTLLCIAVPAAVLALCRTLLRKPSSESSLFRSTAFLIPLVVATLVWLPQYSPGLFTQMRDGLLLSNPVGEKINDFYYRYTLYPANVFKSQAQRQLHTAYVDAEGRGIDRELLEQLLARNDYIPVDSPDNVDLVVRAGEGAVELVHQGRVVLAPERDGFLERPGPFLSRFSHLTDRHAPFRTLVFFCLVPGFPIFVYALFYSAFFVAALALFPVLRARRVAGIGCLALGLLMLVPVYRVAGDSHEGADLMEMLESPESMERVAGLRSAWKERVDLCESGVHQRFVDSPHVAERYWVARCLARCDGMSGFSALLEMADDGHPNVECMAVYSLARTGAPQALPPVLEKVRQSPDWYVQMYAYKALERLGWRQGK